jgi:hypothetical protein
MSRIDYAIRLYEELDRRAFDVPDGRVFEGSKVEAFRATQISQGYYSLLFNQLVELGCIETLRKGGRHRPSIVLLYGAPNREQLAQNYRTRLTKPQTIDTMREWVSQLESRIERLEREVGVNGSQAANPDSINSASTERGTE